jgi:hypothetical protein
MGCHLRQGQLHHRQPISSCEFRCGAKAHLVSHWHLHHNEFSGQRRSYRDPRGMPAGVTRSCTHGGTLSGPLNVTTDALKSVVEGRRDNAIQGVEEAPKPLRRGASSTTRRPPPPMTTNGPSAALATEATISGKH